METEAPEVVLAVENLTVKVPRVESSTPLLDQVCFSLREGEAVAITGQSGSGKSTLLRAILGLLDQTWLKSGTITLRGRSLTSQGQIDQKAFRAVRGNSLAMIQQNPNEALHPLYRVGSQMLEHLKVHVQMSRPKRKSRALEALSAAGLEDSKHIWRKRAHELSGGEAQRVCLALALSTRPKVLLADEILSALDGETSSEVASTLKELQAQGMSLVFVSHDLGAISRICTRIAILYEGKIVDTGSVSDVFAKPGHQHTALLLKADRTLRESE